MERTIKLKPGQNVKKFLKPGEEIIKKSIDARHKPDVKVVYTLGGRTPFLLTPDKCTLDKRPVIAGFGPAGMFAGLYLARAGAKPIILERGSEALKRKAQMDEFKNGGAFSSQNNAQFGEGGAGTFSDGKLNTTTHDARIKQVLQIFYEHGADESVLYDSKPHMGTDVLINVVQSIRREIISLGGEVRFETKLESINIEAGKVVSVIANGQTIECDSLILATGHSARDTFEVLYSLGVPLERKAFSMGARIEHLQSSVNHAQYGGCEGLGAADYKLSYNGTYTFCMCPGGYVFASNSEPDSVCTNGMSYSGRAGKNSNSALLVTLKPDDFPGDGPLAGMYWQREIEKKAYEYGGGNYLAPAQLLKDFMAGTPSTKCGKIEPTYQPGVIFGDISEVLPEKVIEGIRCAIPEFDKKLHGFNDADAVLTAPETRSSSPVRILRDENCQSSVLGLYPCGEGAGYAGGITSSAVDGLRCAQMLINNYYKK